MGHTECRGGEHDFATTNLGAGMARFECRQCAAVLIDLDAAEDGAPVTAPGLFGPVKPTIFSVLAEERREIEKAAQAHADAVPARHGPAFAYGGSARRR